MSNVPRDSVSTGTFFFDVSLLQNHVLSICVGNADAWANVSPPPVSKFSHGAWERVVSTSQGHVLRELG